MTKDEFISKLVPYKIVLNNIDITDNVIKFDTPNKQTFEYIVSRNQLRISSGRGFLIYHDITLDNLYNIIINLIKLS